MAERRMLSKNLILFDGLADLPHTTQLLYIYLNIQADDDGFVGNPRPVCGMLGCDSSHLDTLLGNGYLLQFEGGMVVIRHWHVHNQIRKDRYKPTRFLEERARLTIDDTGCYQMAENAGFSLVDNLATQERTGQDRVEKDRIEEDRKDQESTEKERQDEDRPATGTENAPAGQSSEGQSSAGQSSVGDISDKVYELYQELCPSLEPCRYLSNALRRKIRGLRLPVPAIAEGFARAESTPFLRGGGEKGWVADLNWLCTEDNLQRVLAGAYEPRAPAKPRTIWGCSGQMGTAELEAIQKLLADDSL